MADPADSFRGPAADPSGRARRLRARLRRAGHVLVSVLLVAVAAARGEASSPITRDVWLMDSQVAVQIYDCGDLMCGRVIWLIIPRDARGVLNRDWRNPDPALRQRPLCGLTVLWGLRQGRRSLGRRLVLQPVRRKYLSRLGQAHLRRPDRRAHLCRSADLRKDQDAGEGGARHRRRLVLKPSARAGARAGGCHLSRNAGLSPSRRSGRADIPCRANPA
jgi:hypothetical protein